MATKFEIVVGVDGSDGGRRALSWAVDEAASRGGYVQAITAWRGDDTHGRSEARSRAAAMLAHQIDGLPRDQRLAVDITTDVVEGSPAEVLAAATDDADLLVLGSKGHGRLWSTMLGSVSATCIRQGSCPVVVVPPH